MRRVVKFIALFCGCFAIGAAFVPMVMWGVFAALVNFGPNMPLMGEIHANIPDVKDLIIYHLVYSLEMAVGLLLIKWGLND